MVVFGGGTSTTMLQDTWALALKHEPTWVDLTPYCGAAPVGRTTPVGAYDESARQLVVIGGVDIDGFDRADHYRFGLGAGPALDVVADSSSHGTVTRSPAGGCYSPGAAVTLTARPARGYRFSGWSGDAGGNTNPLTVTMDGYKMIIVHFEGVETATLLAQFAATRHESGVELRWSFGDPGRVAEVAVERAERSEGPWRAIALEMREEAGVTVALDRDAEPGLANLYRLVVRLTNGMRTTFDPVRVTEEGAIVESAITGLTPNPTNGATQFQFAIARAGRVRLTLAGVTGRTVARLVDGVHRPGRYMVVWDGVLDHGGLAPAGIYFARLSAADRTLVRRVAVVP